MKNKGIKQLFNLFQCFNISNKKNLVLTFKGNLFHGFFSKSFSYIAKGHSHKKVYRFSFHINFRANKKHY